jgi:thioredoxin reductase
LGEGNSIEVLEVGAQMTESYDALIVGAGPAGLSAALILGRCRRRVLLCDSGGHRNSASQAIHGLLGHEGRPPSDLLAMGSKELEKYASVTHSRSEALTIVPLKGGFEFTSSDCRKGFARKVLLATGLVDEVPDLPGIDALYGRSVHHCLYCDGFEHRGEPIAAYGPGDKGAGLALMMTQWSVDVVLCTGGEGEVTSPTAQRLGERGIKIFPDRIISLEGDSGRLNRIRFQNGHTIDRSVMFFTTGCHQKSDLSKILGCRRDEKGGVTTDPLTEETSVPRVYVAGDASRDVLLVPSPPVKGPKLVLP